MNSTELSSETRPVETAVPSGQSGGRAFAEPLHVGRPNLGDRERFLSRVAGMFDRNWLSNAGPLVREFEQRIGDLVGVKHCIAMCNATVGLEIAIRAAGLHGEVIVPAFTFIATAHSLQWQEITPVFCDIDPRTHNINPDRVEELITPKTTGIIGVHLWGRPCEVDGLAEIAERHHLKLLFDAAHAFGCSHEGRMIGGSGLAEIFSFHATKFFNTFEGGAILTNNDELAAQIRLMKNFGFSGYDNVIYIGTNGKMTEICAAMGLTNLESLDDFVAANRRNYEAYRFGLSGIPGVSLIRYDSSEKCNYHYIVVEVDEGKAGLNRNELVQVLHAENVLARRYFFPGCHRMEPYRSFYPHARLLLPETEKLAQRVLLLPNGMAVSPAEIEVVCGIIDRAIGHSPKVRKRLRESNGDLKCPVWQ
jgi:dTDP-4-amino-4,6-dideoxygalactose transaminase